MYNNNFQEFNATKPYRAHNMIVKKCESSNDTGTLEVRVFTALGALPIEGAVITVYTYVGGNLETEIKEVTTDVNGIAPPIELPVVYDVNDPYVSPEYFFTHYNLRVKAAGYYTIHIVNIHVFPNIKVLFNVNLTPVVEGSARTDFEEQIVIPNPHIDISN